MEFQLQEQNLSLDLQVKTKNLTDNESGGNPSKKTPNYHQTKKKPVCPFSPTF